MDEKTRMQMFKLRQTWNEIFPPKKMYAIDLRVKGIDPAWPILVPKPSQKNIHLNPKFLDGKVRFYHRDFVVRGVNELVFLALLDLNWCI